MVLGISKKSRSKQEEVKEPVRAAPPVSPVILICGHGENLLGGSSFISGNSTPGGLISFMASLVEEGEIVTPERSGTGTTAVLNFLIKESPNMGSWGTSDLEEVPSGIPASVPASVQSVSEEDEERVEFV